MFSAECNMFCDPKSFVEPKYLSHGRFFLLCLFLCVPFSNGCKWHNLRSNYAIIPHIHHFVHTFATSQIAHTKSDIMTGQKNVRMSIFALCFNLQFALNFVEQRVQMCYFFSGCCNLITSSHIIQRMHINIITINQNCMPFFFVYGRLLSSLAPVYQLRGE